MENNKKEKIILETILERETKDKRKEDTSVSAQYTKNGSCMQTGNKKQKSTFTLNNGRNVM